VIRNLDESKRWFILAADQGYKNAINALEFLKTGNGEIEINLEVTQPTESDFDNLFK
jgi:TPR repeat protein